MSFLSPLAALGLLVAIPIILLYILRLRRREAVVSSNFLWQQLLRDREANTPWQRLRRNILLFLQLLILILLVLVLMRPAQVVPTITASKTVILLDASASMNARDVDSGTRFEAAQREANLLLNDLTPDDQVSVIWVAESAEPLIPYTNSFLEARAAIFDAEAGSGQGDWSTALTLAAAGAQGTDNFSIIIITDGGIEDAGLLPENIPAPVIVPIGESASNLAITALATRTLAGQNPQLFTQIQNYDTVANEVSLLIRLDGDLWESISPTVSAQSSASFTFEISESFSTVQAELVLDDSVVDYLESDNIAYAVTNENSTRRVLVLSDQRNIFLDEVLRSLPNVQVFTGDVNRLTLPTTPYDLYIFNNYLPTELPDADMLIINPPRSSDIFTLGAESSVTSNVSLATRTHPLSNFLTVDSINLRQFQEISAVDWATPIISTTGGDILVAGDNRGRQVAILNFDLLDSDFPLQIAFPIFMSNVIEWATPANVITGGTNASVGDVVRINPPLTATRVQVTLPDGTNRDVAITSDTLSFAETQQTGFYTITITHDDESVTTQALAVNLFGANESNIAPLLPSEINLGGGQLDEEAEEQFGFRELWRPLAILALFVLLYEWHLYHKRLRVPVEADTDVHRTTARN
ncbi:MAG: VWA domain-containing protein [Chloroflexota bacterium]